MPSTTSLTPILESLFDAGPIIGALMIPAPRHAEAFPLVESARTGIVRACTTIGLLNYRRAEPLGWKVQTARLRGRR